MHSKITILTSVGMTELGFLWLIPPYQILFITDIQSRYQFVACIFQCIESRRLNPFPNEIIDIFAAFFGIPLCNQPTFDCLYAVPSTKLKDYSLLIDTNYRRFNCAYPVSIDDNCLRVGLIFRSCSW